MVLLASRKELLVTGKRKIQWPFSCQLVLQINYVKDLYGTAYTDMSYYVMGTK